MRRLTFGSLLLALLTACGEGSGAEDAPPASQDENEVEDTSCLNCGLVPSDLEPLTGTAPQTLSAAPETLMFYGDSASDNASELLNSQLIQLHNATSISARVTSVSVVPNPSAGAGGEAYFEVSDIIGSELSALEGSVQLDVRFLGSTQQRSAIVVIQTDHPRFPLLSVSVTGKTFVGFDW